MWPDFSPKWSRRVWRWNQSQINRGSNHVLQCDSLDLWIPDMFQSCLEGRRETTRFPGQCVHTFNQPYWRRVGGAIGRHFLYNLQHPCCRQTCFWTRRDHLQKGNILKCRARREDKFNNYTKIQWEKLS